MWRHALLITTAIATTSCALIDKTTFDDAAPDTPQAWISSPVEPAPPRGDWISAFEDAALRDLIVEGLTANYDLATTSARYDQAVALARAAGAARLPSVDANLTGSETEVVDDSSGVPVVGQFESYGLALSASWEADFWGRLADRAHAGAADAAAAEADLLDAQLSIAGSIAQGWYDLVESGLQTELAEDEVATNQRALNLTQRRYEAGVSGALDVRLARSSLASSEAALYGRRNLENDASRRLEVLLGRYPEGAIEAADDLPNLRALAGAGAPGELLARRPDLRAAETRLAAAGLRGDEARKALLPRLTLTGSAGANGDLFEEAFDPDYLVTALAGSLLQPVFRGGALRAEAARTQAVARERLASYANLALTAFREVEGALDAEVALTDQETALWRAVEEAISAEALAEREYARGVGTIFELLDAQRRRISAERSLITTRADRVANRVSLYIAIGGDFILDLDPS